MRLLIDTHILLWWLSDDPALPVVARTALATGANDVLVSAISIAEISIKRSLGKLAAPPNVWEVSKQAGFADLAFDGAHGIELANLPWHHRDPFDRMLIAQARVERLIVVSVDPRFSPYDIALLSG